jgi:hypothetical protein
MNRRMRLLLGALAVLGLLVAMNSHDASAQARTFVSSVDQDIKVFRDGEGICRYQLLRSDDQDEFRIDPNRAVRLFRGTEDRPTLAQIVVGNRGAQSDGPYYLTDSSSITRFMTRLAETRGNRTEHDIRIDCCGSIRYDRDRRPTNCIQPRPACAVTDDSGRCRQGPPADRPRRGPSIEEPLRAMWDRPLGPILAPGGPRMIIIDP